MFVRLLSYNGLWPGSAARISLAMDVDIGELLQSLEPFQEAPEEIQAPPRKRRGRPPAISGPLIADILRLAPDSAVETRKQTWASWKKWRSGVQQTLDGAGLAKPGGTGGCVCFSAFLPLLFSCVSAFYVSASQAS